MTFRLAAVGDLHCHESVTDFFRQSFEELNDKADALILCGDLTRRGKMAELEVLISELSEVRIPTIAVLGNHDYHEKNDHRFHNTLEERGIVVLDGDTHELKLNGISVGFTGTKGFAGGFGRRALPDFGEEVWRELFRETEAEGEKLRQGLRRLKTDIKIVGLHYAPVVDTLTGEDPQVYAFLGSSLLAEAIDSVGADLIVHSHAHFGQERGTTAGGIPVRNVALPMLGASYRIYELPFAR